MAPYEPQDIRNPTEADPTHRFVQRLDAVLYLARSHRQQFSEIVDSLEEARIVPLNSIMMDTALIRAHAAIKRQFKYIQTEVIFLMTARDTERRALEEIQQRISDLLAERFGPNFYGNPQPEQDTLSVVVLCIIVTVGLALLYFGIV
ncbi:hypothetical protein VP1G_01855 [Cytospora mali]|uniref:Uncharacterized protein n=1 Tax=Cytospora mali TaxID=578113 RepID=A0A194USF8_CYTMA|nr:hypothetical protein VP1G_01855 [Valsa mali var. pyri (nom. inval.)]